MSLIVSEEVVRRLDDLSIAQAGDVEASLGNIYWWPNIGDAQPDIV